MNSRDMQRAVNAVQHSQTRMVSGFLSLIGMLIMAYKNKKNQEAISKSEANQQEKN